MKLTMLSGFYVVDNNHQQTAPAGHTNIIHVIGRSYYLVDYMSIPQTGGASEVIKIMHALKNKCTVT